MVVHGSKYDKRRRAESIFLARHLHLLDTIYVHYPRFCGAEGRTGGEDAP